jgi:hypothetical protein
MTKPPATKLDAFDFPSVTKPEGYLHVDHRASPGLPEHLARKFGFDPAFTREGKVFEAATMACSHCPSVVIKNPLRTRERGRCSLCGGFICDACEIAMHDSNYVHRSRQQILDMVSSGKWIMSGSMSLPIFTPRKETSDG